MMLGGIIAGALGGASQGAQYGLTQNIDQQNKMALMQQQADLEKQKMDYGAQLANQQRAMRVANVQAAIPGIVDSQVAAQYPSLPGAEDGGDNGLRNAQDAAASDARARIAADPRTGLAAEASLGYTDYGTASKVAAEGDQTMAKLQIAQGHDIAREQMATQLAISKENAAATAAAARTQAAATMANAKMQGHEAGLSAARAGLADSTRYVVEGERAMKDLADQATVHPDDLNIASQFKSAQTAYVAAQAQHDYYQQQINLHLSGLSSDTGAKAAAIPVPTPPPPPLPGFTPPGGAAGTPAPGSPIDFLSLKPS